MEQAITKEKMAVFETHLMENEKSKATIEKYRRDLCAFSAFLQGRSLDKQRVLEYKNHLGSKYAVSSANSMLAALNCFFRLFARHELCVKPFKMQKEAYCSEKQELSKGEYLALIQAAERKRDKRLALVLQTICATGIRVSELQSISVEAVKRGEAIVFCKGKTRKIFLVKLLRKKLLAYAKEQGIAKGSLFITKNGKDLDRSNIWRQMKQLCIRAKVDAKKVFPHNLRHLFARTFYKIEKDIAKLADILGHSNINTTRIYIITSGAEHQRRMENLRLLL